jgi:hypothetical protein
MKGSEMAVVAIDLKARCKSRAKRFEAWADEECGGVSFDEPRDPTLYGVEDVGELHGLAHIQLISPLLDLRDETGHPARTWYGLLAEPRIWSSDPRIDRLGVRLRAKGIRLLNTAS